MDLNQIRQFTPVLPIDLALTLARKFWGLIFTLGITLFSIEAILQAIAYFNRLEMREQILIRAIAAIPQCWVNTVAVLLVLAHLSTPLRDLTGSKQIDPYQIMRRGFIYLPKVVLSYLLVWFLVAIGFWMLIIPGLLLLAFLIWAPAYCSAEISIVPKVNRLREDEDDYQPEDTEAHYFKGMPLFALGLSRSAQLSAANLPTVFQLLILSLSAFLLPWALIYFLFSNSLGFAAELLLIFITSILGTFVSFLWAATFCVLLPREQKRELNLAVQAFEELEQTSQQTLRRKPYLLISLLTINMLAAWFGVSRFQQAATIPEHVNVRLEGQQYAAKRLEVKLELEDPRTSFRWLNTKSFMLEIETLKQDSVEIMEETEARQQASLKLNPTRIVVYTASGELLSPTNISPTYEPLLITLIFENIPQAAENENYSLFYAPNFSEPTPLLSGRIASSKW